MDQLKPLFSGIVLESDGLTKAYSVPAVSVTDARKTQTLVTSIHIVGQSATPGNVRIWVVPDADVPPATNEGLIIGDFASGTIADTETKIIEVGLTLSYDSTAKTPNGIYVRTSPTGASIAYNFFGVEITDD